MLPKDDILLFIPGEMQMTPLEDWRIGRWGAERAPTWKVNKLTARAALAEMLDALRANTAPRAPT